jgi:hypothetical protein
MFPAAHIATASTCVDRLCARLLAGRPATTITTTAQVLIRDERKSEARKYPPSESGRAIREAQEVARSFGFELFVKRAKIGTNKHVRVRPRFDRDKPEAYIKVIASLLPKDLNLSRLRRFSGSCSITIGRKMIRLDPSTPSSLGDLLGPLDHYAQER